MRCASFSSCVLSIFGGHISVHSSLSRELGLVNKTIVVFIEILQFKRLKFDIQG